MPIRSGNPLAAALAQSNDIQTGLANVFAPFSPINTMQAGLLKAQTDLASTKAQVERDELAAKQPLYAAQTQNQLSQVTEHNSAASLNNAQRDKVSLDMQIRTGQWAAQKRTAANLEGIGVDPARAALTQDALISAQDSSAKQVAGAITELAQLAPFTGKPGDQVFPGVGDRQFPKAAPQPPQSVPFLPQVQPVTPFSSATGAFSSIIPQMPQEAAAPKPLLGPTGDLTAVPTAPAPQANAGYTVGSNGAISIPVAKSVTSNPTLLKLADEASSLGNSSYGVYREAQRLNNPESLKKAVNPLGDGMLGNALDWMQQSSTDPGVQDRLAFKNFKVNDWLTKSSKLKGAITEAEGAQLRSGQPGSQASAEVKSNWLNNVGYYAKMEADWQAANQEALQTGTARPIPTRWKEDYIQQNPPPALAGVGADKPTAPASGASASDELVPVIDPTGNPGRVLRSKLPEALKRGFKQK